LHPSLTGFKSLYDAGKLNIINSVGYPLLNKSHFAGRALVLNGGDGTVENSTKTSGWMARFLNSGYDYSEYSDPLGIQMGAVKPSLGFHSEQEHKVDVNLTGQSDLSGYYNVISNIGNPIPTDLPDSDYGDNIDFIGQIEAATNSYSERISEVFDNGSNSSTDYPDYELANQLKTVARLIKGGSKTKVFLVIAGGYDTHANQVQAGASHEGTHAALLKELGDSVKAFQEDLEAMSIDDKVVSATFTEFGRKPIENGNYGSDHGNLGPMFVIGSGVNGGITGTNLDLSNITNHFDETKMQHDYRQVFTTILADFLGANDAVIGATEFSDFDGDQKLDLIGSEYIALGTDKVELSSKKLSIYPNPVEDKFVLRFESKLMFRGYIVLYDMLGQVVLNSPQDFTYGVNILQAIDIGNFAQGHYVIAIKDGLNKTIAKSRIAKQ